MNTKTLVAGLIGGIAFFLLGWLVWGILLMDMMAGYSNASCMKPEAEMNMPYLIIANLLWGLAYAYIFSNWKGEHSFKSGLVPGAIISVVIGIAYDLFSLSMTTMITGEAVLAINVIANGIVGALVGGLITWWLGRK